jgi:putative PIG3 family NAD(P)H quinone oxidoreductase
MQEDMRMGDWMRAVGIRSGKGDAEALFVEQVATPAPAPGQILIKIRAAGVNRPDIAQREGNYPPPPGASEVMGLEVAGTVEALGEGASRWRAGDRVTALLPGGGYAEYAVVDERHALSIPTDMDFTEAAGLPETIYTVWANLFERGHLAAGDTVLIHGANSGIGTTATLMAKAAGARVLATARGATKAARAKEMGADLAIDVEIQDFAAVAQEHGGVDVVLDIIGGDYFNRNIAALKTDGRLVQIAFLGGREVKLDLMTLLFKRLTIVASTLRARPADEKARLTRAIADKVWPWVESGQVRAVLDRTYPLEQVADAHRRLEAGEQFGKVVLIP